MFRQTLNQMGFWLNWLLISFLIDVIPTLISCLRLLFKKRPAKNPLPDFLHQITVIVPVYNSAQTLAACLHSIADSDYPSDHLMTFVVDNGSTDDSFQVFAQCQTALPQLRLHWMQTQQGKATALNAAIYQANSPFIVNIDSDGLLEGHALSNIIRAFNADPKLDALTGAILTDRALIKKPHPHTYEIKYEFHLKKDQLVPFNKIEDGLAAFLQNLNGKFLNDEAPFDKINPTLENLAGYLCTELAKQLAKFDCVLDEITVSASPTRAYHIQIRD